VKIEIIKKASVVTVPKDKKPGGDEYGKQTNTRFIWSFDNKPCHDAPTSKPEKSNG